MQKTGKVLLLAFLSLFLAHLISAQSSFIDTGVASYYAKEFHGRKTASGERYDMNKLTAAHPTLPFNTMVKVTNLKNKRSVIVRINDRGPYTKKRIIDLSKAAATKIGLIQSGIGNVRIEVINANKSASGNTKPSSVPATLNGLQSGKRYTPDKKEVTIKGYSIQTGSFSDLKKSQALINKFKKSGYSEIYIEVTSVKSKKVYRVLVGSFENKEKAEGELKKIKKKGYTGFVKFLG